MIKILICDGSETVCQYYHSVLSEQEDFEIVGTAANKKEAISLCLEKKPHILLTDIRLDTDKAGFEVVQTVKEQCPNTKIIILSAYEADEKVFEAYRIGVEDYFFKSLPDELLIFTIRNVYENKHTLRPEIAQKILSECARIQTDIKQTEERQKSLLHTVNVMSMLSNSEFEILKALYDGMTVAAIAEGRFISESTVRTHIGRILRKFECSSTKALVSGLRDMNAFAIFDEM